MLPTLPHLVPPVITLVATIRASKAVGTILLSKVVATSKAINKVATPNKVDISKVDTLNKVDTHLSKDTILLSSHKLSMFSRSRKAIALTAAWRVWWRCVSAVLWMPFSKQLVTLCYFVCLFVCLLICLYVCVYALTLIFESLYLNWFVSGVIFCCLIVLVIVIISNNNSNNNIDHQLMASQSCSMKGALHFLLANIMFFGLTVHGKNN